jgi:hypothetical protein
MSGGGGALVPWLSLGGTVWAVTGGTDAVGTGTGSGFGDR